MGGIGKTTFVQVVYHGISSRFDGCCILLNVKEHSLVSLQENLLSTTLGRRIHLDTPFRGANLIRERLCSRMVLIVLDDVDKMEQLEALAGNHNWFGSGSRIIVTTRDRQLLVAHNVDKIYEVKGLKYEDAFELFCRMAFGKHSPPNDYAQLSKNFVSYAKGHPLALKVLGSFLRGRPTAEWESALQKLRTSPDDNIQKILRISYDGLDARQKDLFLDVACFFIGNRKDYVITMLESCGSFQIDFTVLIEKSLITIKYDNVEMHDLLREMGRDIIKQQSSDDPGKRSRLWDPEDVRHVLTKNSGTEAVKGIVIDLWGLNEMSFSPQAFARMTNLKLLKICHTSITPEGYFTNKELLGSEASQYRDIQLNLGRSFEFLSKELRCLHWVGFPLKSLPPKFDSRYLVDLNLSRSKIERLWEGAVPFENLKYVELRNCPNLTKTPDFSRTPNIRSLIFSSCTNLAEVHQSVVNLERLTVLDLSQCKNLHSLPKAIELESLKSFDLSFCSMLEKFPDISSEMECLRELYLRGTSIMELPDSIRYLTDLENLDLSECKNLTNLPKGLWMLQLLETLNLPGCSKLFKNPEDLGHLESSVKLHAKGTTISRLPSSPDEDRISESIELSPLSGLNVERRKRKRKRKKNRDPLRQSDDRSPSSLRFLPDDIGSLLSLRILDLSCNSFVSLPSSIGQLSELKYLNLRGCERLQALPQLPEAILSLDASGCTSLERLPATSMRNVRTANFSNCWKLVEKQGIEDLVETLLPTPDEVNRTRFPSSCLIPGSEIPKLFRHPNRGNSISIPLPPSWYDNVIGIAMCVLFEQPDPQYTRRSKPNLCKEHLYLECQKLDSIQNYEAYHCKDDFIGIEVTFNAEQDYHVEVEKSAAFLMFKEGTGAKHQETVHDTSSGSDASDKASIERVGQVTLPSLYCWNVTFAFTLRSSK